MSLRALWLGLVLSALAAAAQAQTTFTYRELDRAPAAALARKTLGAQGEGFPLLKRETGGGMIWTGSRYFTFAETPKSGFDGGCQARRAHAEYRPVERHGRTEPPQAKLKLEPDSVWFEYAFARLPNAPAHDDGDASDDRMDRLCAKIDNVFDMFTAKNAEAAGRAMKVIDILGAGPAPQLSCDRGDDCQTAVARALTGQLFHVEQWDCGPLTNDLPPAVVVVCQELRFDFKGDLGILRVRFQEGTDFKTQTRVITLQAVHAEETRYIED